MMKLMFLGLSVMSMACSSIGQQNVALEGVWIWQDVDQMNITPILKKHVLILGKDSYEEFFFENNQSKGSDNGVLFTSQKHTNIEFSTTGNIQIVYKGILLGNQLMIVSKNDKALSPPALYKRQ